MEKSKAQKVFSVAEKKEKSHYSKDYIDLKNMSFFVGNNKCSFFLGGVPNQHQFMILDGV